MKLFSSETMPKNGANVTTQLQTAIDQAAAASADHVVEVNYRGRLIIDKIVLRSGLHLVISQGCTLKASGQTDKYYSRPGPFERLNAAAGLKAVIAGVNIKDVTIRGGGVIDGNYQGFLLPEQPTVGSLKTGGYPRPELIYCQETQGLEIRDVTLLNVPFWTIHLAGCTASVITHVTILNDRRMPNTDGIDIDRSRQTRISHCLISTGDDAICAKCTEETSQLGNCEDMQVSDCVLSSTSAAVKVGSNSFGDFRRLSFDHLTVLNSNRGLAIQLRDGGRAEHIRFSHCFVETKRFSPNWWGRAEPIYLTVAKREAGSALSTIANVTFENVTAEAENGIFVWAPKPSLIAGLSFQHVLLMRRPVGEGAAGEYDLRPAAFPQLVQAPSQWLVGHGIRDDTLAAIQVE
ncbi:glycoside hydrolase family 28 protein [Lacticaseibacillus camelliae]|uniref:Polygalacturonase n=3 Tax=Lacticaseibacillus camelliae TaxID=381742 RepID=A0A0R2FAM2_9LACO|nr:glycosyl hydrolase family 28 protein [Lacticaseibacillus camelliae]KRN25408.1 hypothetical protein FC75_GL000432 [Lacticaseibacillus camelliae DSM 22697 = JCM 13995]